MGLGGYIIVKPVHDMDAATSARLLERLFELGVRLADTMARGLASRGLTRARAELIWRLRRSGPQTQRSLSVLLDCSARNVTGLVDALEASGHVARGPHPTDRRAIVVRLTAKGTTEAAELEADYEAAAERVLGGLDRVELLAFGTTLETILSRLRVPSQPDDPQASPGRSGST